MPWGRKWMTIPLAGKGKYQEIRKLRPCDVEWKLSHRNILKQSLCNAPRLKCVLRDFDNVVDDDQLVDILIASAEVPAMRLNAVPPSLLRSSVLGVPGRSWQRVLELVKAVGGTRYITGHGALKYLDHESFEREGVIVEYMDYRPIPWPQLHGSFTPYVTVLDLIASVPDMDAAIHLNPLTMSWKEMKDRSDD